MNTSNALPITKWSKTTARLMYHQTAIGTFPLPQQPVRHLPHVRLMCHQAAVSALLHRCRFTHQMPARHNAHARNPKDFNPRPGKNPNGPRNLHAQQSKRRPITITKSNVNDNSAMNVGPIFFYEELASTRFDRNVFLLFFTSE